MNERRSNSVTTTNFTRFRLLILLAVGSLLLAVVFRNGIPATDEDTGRKLSSHIPDVTETDISAKELREIIDSLVNTHRWFNSLPFGRFEYSVTVTKSDARYERDIAEAKANSPALQVDETAFPTLAREWTIRQSVTFDDSRIACISRSNAFGMQTEVWDGNVLTGYSDHGTTQEPNYYLKSDVNGSLSKLAWFPQVGTPAIWFYNAAAAYDGVDWQKTPPTLAGATRCAERDCIVLRDARHHWIVDRENHKLYARYSRNDWEQFGRHREVSDGVVWPMTSICMRFGKEGLEWTDRTSVISMRIDDVPEDSSFQMKMEPGVKVCDLRNEYPVVFTSDPSRTEEELAKIYAEARENHDRGASTMRHARELVGEDAPELGTGIWLNSKPLSINQLRGKRSVLLGFGHTACAPCGNMLALFSKLQETSTDQLILIFAASDSISDVEKKLELYSLDCPAFIPSDESGFGEVFERYRVYGYPTLVAIDANGAITSHQVGTLNNED